MKNVTFIHGSNVSVSVSVSVERGLKGYGMKDDSKPHNKTHHNICYFYKERLAQLLLDYFN